jgi:membrane-associated phospholipid phosphatase
MSSRLSNNIFLLSFCILHFYCVDTQAQFKGVITDLNSNAELELGIKNKYYVNVKGSSKAIFTSLLSIQSNSITFDSLNVSPESINWISKNLFNDSPYKLWCRSNLRNWGLCKTPDYDFQNNHLLEILPDSAKMLIDSDRIETPTNKQLLRTFIPQLGYNFWQQTKAPFRISGQQWAKTFLNSIILGALLLYDQGIDDGLRQVYNENSGPYKASKQVSRLGAEVGLGFTGFWLGKGLLTKNNKATETSLLALQAALTSTVWNRLLKYSTLRERPYSAYQNNNSAFNFKGIKNLKTLYNKSDFHSFGSGHTTTAFALATVYAEQYQDVPMVKIACYTLAASVGVSRMIIHKHWSSDVLMAAMIGYACGKQVTSFKQKFFKHASSRFKIKTTVSTFACNEKTYPTFCITATPR